MALGDYNWISILLTGTNIPPPPLTVVIVSYCKNSNVGVNILTSRNGW